MRVVAIITARGGSKRIPRKNIRDFMGRPMIDYAIRAALGSRIFEEVMVSTDSEEIAAISEASGAEVPFMRSESASNDLATTADAICEVLENYRKLGKSFDGFCCIYPCVPLLSADILSDAFDRFASLSCDSLVPVVKYSHPIQRAFELGKDGFIKYREPEFRNSRTQDLPPAYHDAGMFYFSKVMPFLETKSLVSEKTIPYEMEEERVQDIDTPDDWAMAELKYKMIYNA